MNHKLELMDQFDDAAFALMMDEYAEAEGERLRAEFEEAMRSGTAPACPPELDEKCRKQIKRHFGKQRRSAWAGIARRAAGRAAACLLIALGISATLIMSVEALRVPFFEYITSHYDEYNVIDYGKSTPHESVMSNTGGYDPVFKFLPDGFETVVADNQNGRVNALYMDHQGSTIEITMSHWDGGYSFPPEDETHTYVQIAGIQPLYITENGRSMMWCSIELETFFTISADMLPEDEFMDLCRNIIELYQNAECVAGDMVENALLPVLTDDFQEVYCANTDGLLSCMYETSTAKYICFYIAHMEGVRAYDTEDTIVTDTTVSDYDAIYIKDTIDTEHTMMTWFDEDRNIDFTCMTDGISERDFLNLCEYLAEYYKGVTLPAVSTVIWD